MLLVFSWLRVLLSVCRVDIKRKGLQLAHLDQMPGFVGNEKKIDTHKVAKCWFTPPPCPSTVKKTTVTRGLRA